MMNLRRYRPGVIWLGLLVALSLVWFAFARTGDNTQSVTITQVVKEAADGDIRRITQVENSRKITVEYKDTHRRVGVSRLPQDTNIFTLLKDANVDPSSIQIDIKEASRWGRLRHPRLPAADALPGRHLRLHDAAGAGQQQPGDVVRQEPGPPLHRQQTHRDVLPTWPGSTKPRKSWSRSSSS